ncbi:MAG: hypothetical protein KF788_12975 [Piscinibacter sp.]|nr:hypothetical protein [Piscinibacter sp.]
MPQRSRPSTLWCRAAAAAALACACASGGAAEPVKKPGPVLAPHYGDTLFHFFQDRYFTAITTLMASQQIGRIAPHDDEAEILRGGMLLSYGLHREAGEIFAQLIERGASPAVQDRAWFFLAKIRYQRGLIDEAEAAIGRIGKNLPPALEEERVLLQANLMMARGDYAGAAGVLGALAGASSASLYARFNLGVALVRSGDAEQGARLLDEVGRTPELPTEELRSLRDKANVALGYSALQDKKPEAARVALERVRLTSLHSNKALLGFGWAAAEMKEPRKALVPWTELAQRDFSDAAVLEARIAVPYAYAELGAFGQSLARYEEAIAAFDEEGRHLDESIAAIRAGKLLDGLIERNPGDEMGWFWNIRELPEMPHANHLTQVLAQHEFQEAFKNFRDLRFLANNLKDWQDNLGAFDDMLANRRQAYTERLPKVRERSSAKDIAALAQRRDAVTAETQRAETEADGVAFADEREQALMARLKEVQANLQALGDAAEPAARERARLAAGALTWQLAQEYPARLWEAKKGLQAIDAGLADAQRLDAAISQAERDEPVRFDRFAARIKDLGGRIQALVPRVAALSNEQQGQVQELAVAELTRQKERLAVYATQARFAVAQLYDRATAARKDDRAPAQ